MCDRNASQRHWLLGSTDSSRGSGVPHFGHTASGNSASSGFTVPSAFGRERISSADCASEGADDEARGVDSANLRRGNHTGNTSGLQNALGKDRVFEVGELEDALCGSVGSKGLQRVGVVIDRSVQRYRGRGLCKAAALVLRVQGLLCRIGEVVCREGKVIEFVFAVGSIELREFILLLRACGDGQGYVLS